jgi:hypothetical protein
MLLKYLPLSLKKFIQYSSFLKQALIDYLLDARHYKGIA